ILSIRNEWRVKPTEKNGNKYSRKHTFSCIIKCGFCGCNLTRRRHHSGTEHEKWIWHCRTYSKRGKKYCPECKAIDEKTIEDAFVQSYNLLANDNSDVLDEFMTRLETSIINTDVYKALAKLDKQIKSCKAKNDKLLNF